MNHPAHAPGSTPGSTPGAAPGAAPEPIAPGEEWRAIEALLDHPTPEDDHALRAARRGIQQHRMSDATLRLLDRHGRPLSGLEVEIEQLGHAFPFGDQLWHLDALVRDGRGDGEQARAWRQRFAELFNAATSLCYWTERPRNDASKTEDRQGQPRVENFAHTVAWTRSEGLLAKGHPLFWSIPKCWPDWLSRYDTATQMKFAEVRVRSLVARFRGKVRIWDAVNESLWEAAPKNLARRNWPHIEPIPDLVEYIAPVIRWCREEDPDAAFLINDYGTELEDGQTRTGSDGSSVTAASQRHRYLQLANALADADAAPDALGLQAHTGGWQPPRLQLALYDQFHHAGWPIHITEFWAHTDALRKTGRYDQDTLDQMQARFIADYLTVAFGHPAVHAFFFWGFLHSAIRWHDSLSGHDLQPAYILIRRLLHQDWHTRQRLTTSPEGTVRFRGFHGTYSARIRRLGRTFDLAPHAAMPITLIY